MARVAPGVRVVDLTHGVARHDVTSGAVVLADAVPYLPPPVSLAVVDPGVGTSRRAIAVSAEGPQGIHWFVGPDNGLLSPALTVLGGARSAWVLNEPEGVSATFHGRDLFAPAAARLAAGEDPAALGRPLDPAALVRLSLPAPAVSSGRLATTVLAVDGFGNLTLSAQVEDLHEAKFRRGQWLALTVHAVGTRAARLGRTFSDVPQGRLVVLIDSTDRVAIAVRGGSAAERLRAAPGTRLTLSTRGA
jgi:S-adenosylmethionine hydrolase